MRCGGCRTIYQGRTCPNCSPPFNLPADQILPPYPPGIWQLIDDHPVLSRIKPLLVLILTVLIGVSLYGGKQAMKEVEYDSEHPRQSISMGGIAAVKIRKEISGLHPFTYEGLYYRVNEMPATNELLTSASLSYSSDRFSGNSPDTAVIMIFSNKEKASREFEADKARFKSLLLPLQTYKKRGAYDQYCYTSLVKNGNTWSHQILVQKQNLVIIVWGYEANFEDNRYSQKLIDALADYLEYYDQSERVHDSVKRSAD
ncbi:MAG: hypothetical protein ACM3UZ_14625 [Acidobacteriota bacterium]